MGIPIESNSLRIGIRLSAFTRVFDALCPTNALIGTLHDRMPVILAEQDWARWLGEEPATPDELKALLVPCKDDALTLWPVNRQSIGNVRNKDREVALPEAVS